MKSDHNHLTWHNKVGIGLVFSAFVIVASFYGGMQFQKLAGAGMSVQDRQVIVNDPRTQTLPIAPTDTQNRPAPRTGAFASYISTGSTYTLTVFKMLDQDICGYVVNDRYGHALEVSSLFTNAIALPCSVSGQKLTNGFQKWLDDNRFTMSIEGKTYVIDVAKKTATPQ